MMQGSDISKIPDKRSKGIFTTFRSITAKYLILGTTILTIIIIFTLSSIRFTNHLQIDHMRIHMVNEERAILFEVASLLNLAAGHVTSSRRREIIEIIKKEKIPFFEQELDLKGRDKDAVPISYKTILPLYNKIIKEWGTEIKPLLQKVIKEVLTGDRGSVELLNRRLHSYAGEVDNLSGKLLLNYSEELSEYTEVRLLALLLASIFFIAVIFLVRRSLIIPIRRLTRAAARLEQGDFDVEVGISAGDELGELSERFNSMAQALQGLFRERARHVKEIELLASFPEKDPYPVIECGSDCKINYLNPEAKKLMAKYALQGVELLPGNFSAIVRDMKDKGEKLRFCETRIDDEMVLGEYLHILKNRVRIYTHDITERKRAEQQQRLAYEQANIYAAELREKLTDLKRAETELRRLSSIIENSINIIVILNPQGDIEHVNPRFEEITGYSKGEVIGKNPKILSYGEANGREFADMWKAINSGATWKGVLKNRTKDGVAFWVNAVVSPLRDRKGTIINFLVVEEDITEKRESMERAEFLTSHDPLTSLVNRERFMKLLNSWIAIAGEKGCTGVLVLVDVDQFKAVNEIYGHMTGDKLLVRVADVLRELVNRMDSSKRGEVKTACFLSRFGSDEFFIFMPERVEEDGMQAAEGVRQAMQQVRIPGVTLHITVSIGIAIYPLHGGTSKDLLSSADAALVRANELSTNQIRVFRPEDMDLEKLHSRLQLVDEIKTAIREDRIAPWYQPILNLKTGLIDHYEALVRMTGVDGKIIPPSDFIDVSERFGLILQIGKIVIRKTMELQSYMRRRGFLYTVDMNLSGKDLAEDEMLQFIRSSIEETNADTDRLIFEITETAAVQNLEKAVEFIDSLRAMGCKFALDDFGVGFTSFAYLKNMKIDYIKIDGSFIRRLHEDKRDQLFVKAMVDVARGLGIETIAEFVETGETVELLKGFGVDYAQGYFVGRPEPQLKNAPDIYSWDDVLV